MTITSLIVNVLITIFAYLLIPMVIILLGKKYDEKRLKKINTINSVVVWLIFRIIEIVLSGTMTSGAAVFLWGPVGYWILKKRCLKENVTTSRFNREKVESSQYMQSSLTEIIDNKNKSESR